MTLALLNQFLEKAKVAHHTHDGFKEHSVAVKDHQEYFGFNAPVSSYENVELRPDKFLENYHIQALKHYKGYLSSSINNYLRTGQVRLGENEAVIQPLIAKIDEAFEKIPPITNDIIAYRGIISDRLKEYQQKSFINRAYTSLSLSRKKAQMHGGTVIPIYIPKGTKVLWLDFLEGFGEYSRGEQKFLKEDEILLPHTITFEKIEQIGKIPKLKVRTKKGELLYIEKQVGSQEIAAARQRGLIPKEDNIAKLINFVQKAIVSTPMKEGKFNPSPVQSGDSVWITVNDPQSPLSGRHILITKRPDGLFALTGGAGGSIDVAARRHIVLTGSPRKTKRDIEDEKQIEEAEEYNEPIIYAKKEAEKQARQEIREASDKMLESLGIKKLNKTTLLEQKDDIYNYVESVVGKEDKANVKRITDTIIRQTIAANRKVGERIQRERQDIIAKVGKRLGKLQDEE
ncbi:MAG: ADP-ribosyltransferase, partial [Nanoarchaeota archaeon]